MGEDKCLVDYVFFLREKYQTTLMLTTNVPEDLQKYLQYAGHGCLDGKLFGFFLITSIKCRKKTVFEDYTILTSR